MKRCPKCFRLYENDSQFTYSPGRDLGDILRKEIDPDERDAFCPDCREDLGVLNLLGFGR